MQNKGFGCLVGAIISVAMIISFVVVVFHAPQICDFFVTHVFEWIEKLGG